MITNVRVISELARALERNDRESLARVLDHYRAEETLKALMAEARKARAVALVLKRDGLVVAEFDLWAEETAVCDGISAGEYALERATGRVLWRRKLTARELSWEERHVGEELQLAASDEEVEEQPSMTESLAGGEISMAVVPGMREGRILVKLEGGHA